MATNNRKLITPGDHLTRGEISRRDFLKLSAAAAGGLILRPHTSPWDRLTQTSLVEFPDAPFLGRVTDNANVRARPDINSPIVGEVTEDDVLPWLREVVGQFPQAPVRRWVETPVGWIWAPFVQPVKNQPAEPVTQLEATPIGGGMWVQVSVPFVEVTLESGQPLAPWLQYRMFQEFRKPYLFYDQVFWVDDVRTDPDGRSYYRLSELYGSYGDVFWGPAEAFRKITAEELAPISPEVEDKVVRVNLYRQTVQAFENGREVFFGRCSTGQDGEETETPPSLWHRIWRKSLSTHMAGNTAQGYDTPGIGYTTLFVGTGVAFHATFWHNMYGAKRSHGCVNLTPEDAKWIWRWTTPYVSPYESTTPGDMTVSGTKGSLIEVVEF
jgi:hypothetical protein